MKRLLIGMVPAAFLCAVMAAGCSENNEASVTSGTVPPPAPPSGELARTPSDMGKMMQKQGGMGASYPGAGKAGATPALK
jgi:hypothetical protein